MTGDETMVDECTKAEINLQAFFDRALPASGAAAIEAHLAVCTHCAKAYAFEERFRQYVRSCCSGSVSEDRCRDEFRLKLEERCRQVR